MATYLVEPMFNQSVIGGAERYLTKDIGIIDLPRFLRSLVVKRNALLSTRHEWVGVRCSEQATSAELLADTPTPRRSFVLLPGAAQVPQARGVVNIPERGVLDPEIDPRLAPDQFRAALQLQVTFGVQRTTLRYMAMIPDGYSATEPATIKTPLAGWEKSLDAFIAWQIDNCRIKGLTAPDVDEWKKATGLVAEAAAPKRLGVRLLTATAPAIPLGSKILVQGFRRKLELGSKPSLNGTFYVDKIDVTTEPGNTLLFLRGTDNQDPSEWKIFGKVRRKRYAYFDITRIDPYRVGIHKRGRPSMSPRGRRPTRVTLDP